MNPQQNQQQQRPQLPTAGADLEDLIHLPGPLTEDAVMKCLQARFQAAHFYVSTYKLVIEHL